MLTLRLMKLLLLVSQKTYTVETCKRACLEFYSRDQIGRTLLEFYRSWQKVVLFGSQMRRDMTLSDQPTMVTQTASSIIGVIEVFTMHCQSSKYGYDQELQKNL